MLSGLHHHEVSTGCDAWVPETGSDSMETVFLGPLGRPPFVKCGHNVDINTGPLCVALLTVTYWRETRTKTIVFAFREIHCSFYYERTSDLERAAEELGRVSGWF